MSEKDAIDDGSLSSQQMSNAESPPHKRARVHPPLSQPSQTSQDVDVLEQVEKLCGHTLAGQDDGTSCRAFT